MGNKKKLCVALGFMALGAMVYGCIEQICIKRLEYQCDHGICPECGCSRDKEEDDNDSQKQ